MSDYTEEDLRLADALLLSWEIVSPKMSQRLAAFRAEARRERDYRYEKWVEEREKENDKSLQKAIARVEADVRDEREACERIVQRMIGESDWSRTGYDTCIEILRRLRERAK